MIWLLFILCISILRASVYGSDDSTIVPCPDRRRAPRSETGARTLYLILLHNERTFDDAVHLFRAIRDPRNSILIHVDRKAAHLAEFNSSIQLHREIRDCPCGSRIKIESAHDAEWSKWSMVLPTIWGMKQAVSEEFAGKWDVFINLSGDNLPVYDVDTTARMLQDMPYNFLTSSSCETGLIPTNVYAFPKGWHKRIHYTRRDTETDPEISHITSGGKHAKTTVVTYFGSQWIILQRSMVEHLVRELDRPHSLASKLAQFLEDSGKLMTDETFIPTYIMHIDKDLAALPIVDESSQQLLWRNKTLSGISRVRYERMDEHIPTASAYFWEDQRYDVPESISGLSVRPWGPYFLGVYDLENIRESGALFIRKVSTKVDPNIIKLLPVDRPEQIPPIQWPEEVEITLKPDWSWFRDSLKASVDDSSEGSDDSEL